ncbi:MAG: HDOD domain-containing protein [Terriglobia bacterium]
MRLLSNEPSGETAAHVARTRELSRRQSVRLKVSAESVLESCGDFDAAAEFAALEGISISEALRNLVGKTGNSQSPEMGTPGHYGRLPVEPRTVSRLLRTRVEEVSTAELEDIAGSDPVLAGRLLSSANSVLYSSRYEITRLRESIMRLGVPESRRVLVAASMSGVFASKAMQDLWKHCEAVATVAGEVAGQIGVDSETAWVVGLLHDIGRVVMATGATERQATQQRWISSGFPLVYAESLSFGQDHAQVGAALLKQWELPAEIIEAVELHHRPECSDSKLVAAAFIAEDVVAARLGTPQEDLWPSMRRVLACQRAGIDAEALAGLNLQQPVRMQA